MITAVILPLLLCDGVYGCITVLCVCDLFVVMQPYAILTSFSCFLHQRFVGCCWLLSPQVERIIIVAWLVIAVDYYDWLVTYYCWLCWFVSGLRLLVRTISIIGYYRYLVGHPSCSPSSQRSQLTAQGERRPRPSTASTVCSKGNGVEALGQLWKRSQEIAPVVLNTFCYYEYLRIKFCYL